MALAEFDSFVQRLRTTGIPLEIFEDTRDPQKPDAIFPNNWFSTHADGSIVLYPIRAENRRTERRMDIIKTLKKRYGYKTVHDLSPAEADGRFLEGTGSIVFDHSARIAYAAHSVRTDKDLLAEVCSKLHYTPFLFSTADRNSRPVYHTNVVMALHDTLAVVCFDAVPENDRIALKRSLEDSGKNIFAISMLQMESFAGNMLFVTSPEGNDFVILSDAAWQSLLPEQQSQLKTIAQPLLSNLTTIENCGGGSARCMIAEII